MNEYEHRPRLTFAEVRLLQLIFESNLVGTDGSLADKNTPEFGLQRGVIGEATEAIQELKEHGQDSEKFREEITDIWVFLASIMNHIEMGQEELEMRLGRKVLLNFIKYTPQAFIGLTIDEGIKKCRENFER